jgi:protein-disulfide isomerase
VRTPRAAALSRRALLAGGAGLLAVGAAVAPAIGAAQEFPVTPAARRLLDAQPGKAVLGAAKTAPLVTELVDFNAPDWRRSALDMRELLAGDSRLAYAIVQTPRLDVGSVEAARIALAMLALHPGKFQDFYLGLAATSGPIDGVKALNVVRAAGIDHYKVFRAANQPEATKSLTEGVELAAALRVLDPPAYVIGPVLVAGYADLARKRALIAAS